MDVEKTLDFSVEAVEDEQREQNANIVKLGCFGADTDNDSYC